MVSSEVQTCTSWSSQEVLSVVVTSGGNPCHYLPLTIQVRRMEAMRASYDSATAPQHLHLAKTWSQLQYCACAAHPPAQVGIFVHCEARPATVLCSCQLWPEAVSESQHTILFGGATAEGHLAGSRDMNSSVQVMQ